MLAWWGLPDGSSETVKPRKGREGRKRFFFEKKNQKLLSVGA
jgi:hypothetical protein